MSPAKKTKKQTVNVGHAAHTKNSNDRALPGEFKRKIKVTFIGAGSTFTPRVLFDIISIPGNQGGTFALVDIDEKRLNLSARLLRKVIKSHGGPKWTVITSTNRKQVMRGSDYIINCIEVSGPDCVAMDNDIPLKYGVDQCIGDTIGPGGLFKGLRTIPVFLEILKDCEKLCPNVQVLNYTNPMAMMCTAAGRVSNIPVVGLCHSVQGTSNLLARYAEVPYDELKWECAGINHLAWFTKLEHEGKDLYPQLKRKFKAQLKQSLREYNKGEIPEELLSTYAGRKPQGAPPHHSDLVRKHMCTQFGAFITESSGHLSEYLPYYRKNEEGRKYLRSGYDGGSRFYASNWPEWRKNNDQNRRDIISGKKDALWKRSWEYASWIIESMEKNVPYRMHGNIMNQAPNGDGLVIGNLPADMAVEAACLVDANGIQPIRFGNLPPQMAAICRSNLAMFDLAAEACITKSKEAAIHALMLDPLTSAVCSTQEIRELANELFKAQADYLPGFK